MKKVFILLLSLLAAAGLPACGGAENQGTPPPEEKEPVEITLWCYPVGDWGTPTAMSKLVTGFRREFPDRKSVV